MAQKITLDPQTKYAIRGRIATFNDTGEIIDDGIIYVQGDTIINVSDASDPSPSGFSKSQAIKCGGTIYPGLIELHNHLSYNIIPMWDVPKKFAHRDQWRSHKDYRKSMTGPLKVLGHIDGYLQAIVRYVECRLLFSGVTSSQGITLASHGGIRKLYKGIVRNVEQTVDIDLPAAKTKIADVAKDDAKKFLDRLKKSSCYLLHLAEGSQQSANKHFRALQIPNTNEYAITDSLAGIHAVGLFPEDFEIMGQNKGNMVWSPMSNLLLYGVTADIVSAKEHGVNIGLGSDWTPSGSKNLLGEMKVAKLISSQIGNIFTDEDIARMATSNAAKILKWDQKLGTIAPGCKADLIVLAGKTDDIYQELVEAKEQTIIWTIIDGIPRCGQKRQMSKFDIALEKVKLRSVTRYLYLNNHFSDNPIDVTLKYTDAKKKLKEGMKNIPALTVQVENSNTGIFAGATSTDGTATWVIEDDHNDCEDYSSRHHISYDGMDTGGDIHVAATPLSELITQPMVLDESTIIEDRLFFKKLALQVNLPEYIKTGLPSFYGQTINLSDSVDYKKEIGKELKSQFNYVISLSKFWKTDGYLNLSDKLNVLDQSKIVLSQAYVHLRQKNSLYAANPIAQLNVIRQELLAGEYEDETELEFHQKIINVFNSVRDLHTMYQLPMPFKDKVAFLPFFIEQYFDVEEKKFIVSKTLGNQRSPFKDGVEITHWNGIPIEKEISDNGRRFAGSNNAARFARGLDSLTFRPLAVMLPPREDWVTVSYIDEKGKKFNRRFNWMVGSIHNNIWRKLENEQAISKLSYSSGYDYLTELIHKTKMYFFAPKIADQATTGTHRLVIPKRGYLKTSYPGHFKAKKEKGIGYVRIYSFNVSEPELFANEFTRLLHQLNTQKVILDIRNNGGGHIWGAEFILQTLTKKNIVPQHAQFINSDLAENICKIHSPSNLISNLDLTEWYNTLKEIKNTGAAFSIAYPITPPKLLRKFKADTDYDVVLITDALCYSASDIFAAGFQDHNIGKILGVHRNTGAGGANVWTHSILYHLTKNENGFSPYFKPLQYGADIRVAVRRTLRNGENRGIPLEDLGIVPDEIHNMTKKDLLSQNIDLITRAANMLR